MAILDEVKLDLRISHSKLDTDITAQIETAKQKLAVAGVEVIEEYDALTVTAIKTWCRAWYNFQGRAKDYEALFYDQRDTMAKSGLYKLPEETDEDE